MSGEVNREVIEAENGVERIQVFSPHESESGEKIKIIRGKLDSLTVYDVTENELIVLERGSDATIWFNFFIGTISIAVTMLVSLFTANWDGREIAFIVFICVSILFAVIATICFVFWFKERGQHKTTIDAIRKRRSSSDIC